MKPEDKELVDRISRRAEACEGQSDIPYMGTPEPDGRPGYDAELDLRAVETIKRLSESVKRFETEVKLLGATLGKATEILRKAVPKHIRELPLGSSVLEGLAIEAERLLSKVPLDASGKRIELGSEYNEFVLGPTGDRKARIIVAVAGEAMAPRWIPEERYSKFSLLPSDAATVNETTPKEPRRATRSNSDRSELLRYLRARRGG